MENKFHAILNAMKLWLFWNILSDLSLAGFFAILPLSFAVGFISYEINAFLLLLAFVLGSVVMGAIQWFAFRGRIEKSYLWIIATAFGWSIVGAIFSFIVYISLGEFNPFQSTLMILAGAFIGIVVGSLQSLTLASKGSGAVWWLLASVLAWIFAGIAAVLLPQTGLQAMGRVVSLIFVNMITGIAYAYLFAESSQKRLSFVTATGLTLVLILLVGILNTAFFSQQRSTFRHDGGEVRSIAFSADGKLLATGGSDNNVIIWNLVNDRDITPSGNSSSNLDRLIISPDSEPSSSNLVPQIIYPNSGNRYSNLDQLAFSFDGELLAGTQREGLAVWNVSTGQELQTWKPSDCDGADNLAFISDRVLQGAGLDQNREVCVWRWDIASDQEEFHQFQTDDYIAAISSDGHLLATHDFSGATYIWDVLSEELLIQIRMPVKGMTNVAFSGDGTQVAIQSWDTGIIMVWDWANARLIQSFETDSPDYYPVLAFSSDSSVLATGGTSATGGTTDISFWDVADGKELGSLRGHSDSITELSFSPDGKHLASCSSDGTARLWEVPEN